MVGSNEKIELVFPCIAHLLLLDDISIQDENDPIIVVDGLKISQNIRTYRTKKNRLATTTPPPLYSGLLLLNFSTLHLSDRLQLLSGLECRYG